MKPESSSVSATEIAVLARAKGVLTGIEAALVAAQIPYRVLSGTAFYLRGEVKAASEQFSNTSATASRACCISGCNRIR